jgi:putative hydrolase of the HAD superfamily
MDCADQNKQASESKYDCLLFDLDDTLYPLSSGLAVQVATNIQEYMIKKLGIDESKVSDLCFSLYKSHGTTMAGLKAVGYEFDADDFHSFVHGRLPYNDKLKPDPVLRSLILSLPIRKILFTNADKAHAEIVLNRLGLQGCFEMIICFETLNPTCTEKGISGPKSNGDAKITECATGSNGEELPKTPVIVCKPSEIAFEQVFEMAVINPQKTFFFDDSIQNVQTGKRIGLYTVWVGSSQRIDGVDYALESIHNLKEALPELWDTSKISKSHEISEQAAVETPVKA